MKDSTAKSTLQNSKFILNNAKNPSFYKVGTVCVFRLKTFVEHQMGSCGMKNHSESGS